MLKIVSDSLGYYVANETGVLYGPYNVTPEAMDVILQEVVERGVTSPTWQDFLSRPPAEH